MNYNAFFDNALNRLHQERRYRVFADLERIAGRFPQTIWHSPQGPREIIVWCSNDYLGMGQHPKVIGAMVETATRMGTGAGGTRNISGTSPAHDALEAELAALHGKDAALLFTCNGRGTNFFTSANHDALTVEEVLGHVPMAGAFCAGEIGPVGGRNFLHGFTASVAVFES